VGWIACLRLFGDIFEIPQLYVLHAISTSIVCITWVVLFILTVVAYHRGRILYAKDVDVWRDSIGEITPSPSTDIAAYHSTTLGPEDKIVSPIFFGAPAKLAKPTNSAV
jgi:hypothetical protein